MRLSAFISHKDSISGFVPSRARELKQPDDPNYDDLPLFVPSRARELKHAETPVWMESVGSCPHGRVN